MTKKTKLFNFFTLILLILTFAFYSCSNEPDNPVEPESSQEQNETGNQEIPTDSNAIVYHLNGGTLPANTRTTYTEQEDVTLAVPEYGDNIFVGWYESEEYPMGGDITGWNAGDKSGTVELYAKWFILELYVDATIPADITEVELSDGIWDVLYDEEESKRLNDHYPALVRGTGFRTYIISDDEGVRRISGTDNQIYTAHADSNEDVQGIIDIFEEMGQDDNYLPDPYVGWYWHKVSQNDMNVTAIYYVEISESELENWNGEDHGSSLLGAMIGGMPDAGTEVTIKRNSDRTQYTITYSYNGGKTQCTYTLKKR